jgi:hypothetical protein
MLQKYVVLIIGMFAVGGCATGEPTLKVSPRDVSGAYCAPLFTVPTVTARLPALQLPLLSSGSDRPLASDGLSPESRQIAEIIGVMDLVRETRALEVADTPLPDQAKQRLVEARQHLSDRLVMIFFEVNSVTGRVDFGLAAGLTGGEHAFSHPEQTNLLRELWEAPQVPTMFPISVWRFLNWPLSEEADYRTRRDELIAEWRYDGLISESSQLDRRATLFFGTGGTYSIDDLRARAQMMEVIKTSLSVMMQYLYLFSQEVLNRQHVAVR